MTKIQAEVLQERYRLLLEAQSIVSHAEGRELTEAERKNFDEKMVRIDTLGKAGGVGGNGTRSAEQMLDDAKRTDVPGEKNFIEDIGGEEIREMKSTGNVLLDSSGREYRRWAPGERMEFDYNPRLRLSNVVRGAITKRFDGCTEEERAASIGSLSGGGYTVPSNMAGQILSAARNKLPTGQVADIVTLPNNNLMIPVCTGDPTASWVPELGSFSESNSTFGIIKMEGHKVGTYSVMSVEVAANATGLEGRIEDNLSYAVNNAICTAAFEGDGNNKPMGLLNNSDIITAAKGGAPTLQEVLNGCYWSIQLANGPQQIYIVSHSRGARYFDALTLAAANPYSLGNGGFTPASWKNILGHLTCNGLAIDVSFNINFYGIGKSNMVIGYDPENVVIEVFRGSDSGITQGKVFVRIYALVDVALQYPGLAASYTGCTCA